MTQEPLLTTVEVAEYLGVPVSTIHRWRYVGTGPLALRIGRHLRFDPDPRPGTHQVPPPLNGCHLETRSSTIAPIILLLTDPLSQFRHLASNPTGTRSPIDWQPFEILPDDSERGYRPIAIYPKQDQETGRYVFEMHGYTPTPTVTDGYHVTQRLNSMTTAERLLPVS